MKHIRVLPALAALLVALFASSCEREVIAPLEKTDRVAPAPEVAALQPKLMIPGSVAVFTTGLNYPSGLVYGTAEGLTGLFVAEAGSGGTGLVVPDLNSMDAVKGLSAPYASGMTGRISYVDPDGGARTTIAEGLPSCQSSTSSGCRYRGVSDLEIVGGTLYALMSGAGPSHGHPTIPNGIIRIDGYSGWAVTADLSQHLKAHPAANMDFEDIEPDGLWHSMVSVNNKIYAIEPNHGEFVEADPVTQEVNRVADVSASQGHIDPSAVVFHNGYFFVGNLTQSPMDIGKASIYRVSLTGDITPVAYGFTDIVGIAFDRRGRMYVLEGTPYMRGQAFGVGELVRVNPGGWHEPLLTGLNAPTAMTFGPDGTLYIAHKGIGQGMVGQGEILRVTGRAEDF
jgi:hypothetical protein